MAFSHLVYDKTHLAPHGLKNCLFLIKVNAAAKQILEGVFQIDDAKRILPAIKCIGFFDVWVSWA
jgi:hypothetical protein